MAGQGKPGRPKKTVEDSETLFPENFPEDLAEVFESLPGEEKVISLFRIQSIGQPAFLISLSPEGLRNLSVIQGEFGGGKYKAVAKNYETGEKVERIFSIEGEPKIKSDNTGTMVRDSETGFFLPKSKWKREIGPESENEYAINKDSGAILKLYERQLDKMENEIERLKEAKSGNGMTEMFQLLIQAKELIVPQAPINQGTVDAQTIFNAMSKGMEMISNRDNENNQPAFVTVAREILPIIQQMLNRVITPKPGQPGPGQSAPPPGLQSNQPAKDITPATGFQALMPMLEPYKQTFIDAASNDDNPELLIPLVARRVPPDKKDDVIKWIQEGKWFQDLVSMDQRISFQRAWWEDFCGGLLKELTGQNVDEPEGVASE